MLVPIRQAQALHHCAPVLMGLYLLHGLTIGCGLAHRNTRLHWWLWPVSSLFYLLGGVGFTLLEFGSGLGWHDTQSPYFTNDGKSVDGGQCRLLCMIPRAFFGLILSCVHFWLGKLRFWYHTLRPSKEMQRASWPDAPEEALDELPLISRSARDDDTCTDHPP